MANDNYKVLNWLAGIFFVLAWVAAAWGAYVFFSQLSSDRHYDETLNRYVETKPGIDLIVGLGILADAALRFLMLMGASQAIKLMLDLERGVSNLGRHLAEVSITLGNLQAGVAKTNEQVRMVGTIVYDEAKKS